MINILKPVWIVFNLPTFGVNFIKKTLHVKRALYVSKKFQERDFMRLHFHLFDCLEEHKQKKELPVLIHITLHFFSHNPLFLEHDKIKKMVSTLIKMDLLTDDMPEKAELKALLFFNVAMVTILESRELTLLLFKAGFKND